MPPCLKMPPRGKPATTHRIGAILGTVELVDCVEESEEYSFFGPYGFVLANPRPLRKPIQVRGRQRFWTVPPNIAGRLR